MSRRKPINKEVMLRPRSFTQLACYILLLKANEESRRTVDLLSASMETKKLRNLACARACKMVSTKLLPDVMQFDKEFLYNVSVARKNELMELSEDLFKLEFLVSEVKEALDTVQNETACMCPRKRDQVKKIEIKIDEGQNALALRFDDIKRSPELQLPV